ncbi:unnamed protein product [Phytophthora fragariaefolia]|uniref:Unnamed protein product n=1 Tax=Phytophthora fragariaefolia TaxID=1490495 RepID=A0A9W6YBW2_9STRA|nr:unnamed protein product [Phytophthora fragariaefolia]
MTTTNYAFAHSSCPEANNETGKPSQPGDPKLTILSDSIWSPYQCQVFGLVESCTFILLIFYAPVSNKPRQHQRVTTTTMSRSRMEFDWGKLRDDLKINPAKTQAVIDILTPSPNATRFAKKSTPKLTKMNRRSKSIITNRRSLRHRANVDNLMRSNMVRQSLTLPLLSAPSASFIAHQAPRVATPARKDDMYGPPPRNDVVIVPIPGDCNFEQKYNVAMSMDEKAYTPMEKLEALRDAMGNITDKDGYIERETFSHAFEVDGNDFDGYATSNGTIDGNVILIDAVMKLGVNAEQKLRFIFDTLDPDNTGYVVEDQIVQLLESNFSSAKIDVVGMEFNMVANLIRT